jgi:hypothetical protein
MSFTPMTDVPNPLFDLNGDPFSGAVLKAYLPGTTTAISIYTDAAGSSPQATLTANAQGAWEVTGSEVVPYIDQDHKWGIFANASDAASNTPFFMGPFDNVTAGVPLTSPNLAILFDNVADMISGTLPDGSTIVLAVGQTVQTLGYITEGDGGDNTYEIVAATGTDDGGSFIDLNVLQAKGLFPGGVYRSLQWGTVGDGSTNNSTDLQSFATYLGANNVEGEIGAGSFVGDFTIPAQCTISGDGWDNTALIPLTDGGIVLAGERIHLLDMRIDGVDRSKDAISSTAQNHRSTFTKVRFIKNKTALTPFTGSFWMSFSQCSFRDNDVGVSGNNINATAFFGTDFFDSTNIMKAVDFFNCDGVAMEGCHLQNAGYHLDLSSDFHISGGYIEAFNDADFPALVVTNSSMNMAGVFWSTGTFSSIDDATYQASNGELPATNRNTAPAPVVHVPTNNMYPSRNADNQRSVDAWTTASGMTLAIANSNTELTGVNTSSTANFAGTDSMSGIGVAIRIKVTTGSARLSLLNTATSASVDIDSTDATGTAFRVIRFHSNLTLGDIPSLNIQTLSIDGGSLDNVMEIDWVMVVPDVVTIGRPNLQKSNGEYGGLTDLDFETKGIQSRVGATATIAASGTEDLFTPEAGSLYLVYAQKSNLSAGMSWSGLVQTIGGAVIATPLQSTLISMNDNAGTLQVQNDDSGGRTLSWSALKISQAL